MGALRRINKGIAKSAKLSILPCSTNGTVSNRWGEKIRMNITEMPANPAHMGIPDISKANALPNKRIARTYSFIAGLPCYMLLEKCDKCLFAPTSDKLY
jgi:hypothetical protein